jgi:sulfite exporter TauE/SafE/copper chaperone CopZ
MHCRSCEILIEEKLSEIPEVRKSTVNHRHGTAEIFYREQKPNKNEIEEAVRAAGYTVGTVGKVPWISRNASNYQDFGIAFLFILGAYILLKDSGLSDFANVGNTANPSGLSVALLIGLTAGFSTCMALVGGFVLGISARHAEKHPEATRMQKFRPHLFFNFGRIVSYAMLGGLLGTVGSFLQLSGFLLGIVTIVVGLVMLLLGLKLTGLFPRLETIGLTLPKGFSRFLGIGKHQKEYSSQNAFLLGALTFFLPCGFTQAMQLYAVSTGSFASGALAMGLFALGTAPGLLAVGGLTSAVKGVFARRFFVLSGIVVVAMAVFNLGNGLNLIGWRTDEPVPEVRSQSKVTPVPKTDPNVKMESGVQVVRMTEHASGYTPNTFVIRKDVPVKWVIDAKEQYSCAASLVVSKLGIQKTLVSGENIIEFTPKVKGQIPFSCSMGMYRGAFTVVE